MHFRHELDHDAPSHDVFAMPADPAFRERASIDAEHEVGRSWRQGER